MLANAGNAIIIGFNVRPDPVAKEEAARAEVELRMYRVIYDAINDVTDAMKGMLAPKFREVELGRAECAACSRYLPRAPLPAATCWRAR